MSAAERADVQECCLTPEDVAESYGCGGRGACEIMRAAGALDLGYGKYRVRPEALARWHAEVSKLENLPADTIGDVCYFISDGDAVKIGWSVELPKRLVALQKSNARPLSVVAVFAGGAASEAYFQGRFRAHLIHSEWFRLEGALAEFLRGLRP